MERFRGNGLERAGNPVFLDAEGQEALELMAQALAITINEMVVGGRPFDSGRYKALLKDLPALPDEAP